MTRDDEDHALLDALLGPMADRLRDVNLPLHILLEGRFGDLNDNQLEMIHAAQDAARAADATLRLVARVRALRNRPGPISDAEREPIRPVDLLRAPLLVASARAEERGGIVRSELAPDLAYVSVDRTAVEEALSILLAAIASFGEPPGIELLGASDAERVHITIRPGPAAGANPLELLLATLLMQDGGATLEVTPPEVRLTLPRATFAPGV
jgi:hypothetical protein